MGPKKTKKKDPRQPDLYSTLGLDKPATPPARVIARPILAPGTNPDRPSAFDRLMTRNSNAPTLQTPSAPITITPARPKTPEQAQAVPDHDGFDEFYDATPVRDVALARAQEAEFRAKHPRPPLQPVSCNLKRPPQDSLTGSPSVKSPKVLDWNGESDEEQGDLVESEQGSKHARVDDEEEDEDAVTAEERREALEDIAIKLDGTMPMPTELLNAIEPQETDVFDEGYVSEEGNGSGVSGVGGAGDDSGTGDRCFYKVTITGERRSYSMDERMTWIEDHFTKLIPDLEAQHEVRRFLAHTIEPKLRGGKRPTNGTKSRSRATGAQD